MSLRKNRSAKYSKSFNYTEDQLNYDFNLRKRRPWWLLLFLLLPLLLLVRCHKDITIVALDPYGGGVPDAVVTLSYVEHTLLKEKKFHYIHQSEYRDVTDSSGIIVFKKAPYSVYSWFFKCKDMAEAKAEKGIMKGNTSFRYHRQSRDTIILGWELPIEVRWLRTKDPVPGACVDIDFQDNVKHYEAHLVTDEKGACSLKTRTTDGRIVTAVVTKPGTSGTLALNEHFEDYIDDVLVLYLDQDVRCSSFIWQSTEDDAWYSVRTFDLGMDDIDIKFSYCSRVVPDVFRIYEGTPSMIVDNSAKLIFSYGDKVDPKQDTSSFDGRERTGWEFRSDKVHCSSRQITVLVTCDYDDDTWWQYKVECL